MTYPPKPTPTPVPLSDRQRLLEEAIGTICRDRNEEYGGPESSFQAIADFWNVYLNHRQSGPFTPGDVALMMDLMKTARLCANPKHADSVRDKAGYAGCYAEVAGIYAGEDRDPDLGYALPFNSPVRLQP